ncbi:MAG TPA: replicative DNA helicase [Leptospiraceae bacterium]|nr:replicative DNA helicase [Leptospiraceae bacterium]HMX34470.1 replicative DNA helicase [Leptospiraceae bacterium]HMY34250.1 replicative DNA helicase [Leptospiraceae bacterium]HMZ64710.1 replicative DNA helicase [Leptospiraceae bacterium]HNA08961.1 replicative DNA helicase [Leptospiraceae bacterium]
MNPDPLYELESEKAFLASILLKGSPGSLELYIEPEDFYHDLHKRMYASMQELIDASITVDPISLTNQLKEMSRFRDEAKDQEYIFNLYRDTVVVQPISYYAKRIKKYSDRRKYIKVLRDSIEEVHAEKEDNEGLFTRIESDLAKISRQVQARGLKLVKDDKSDLIDYVQKMYETKGATSGLRTHFDGLDEVTTGLKPHELIIIAARPGLGKTTFALNIASNVALKEKKIVAIFSLEMGRMELLIKMICAEARINSNSLKTGAIHPSDQKKLLESIIKVTSAPIWIDDSGALTIWEFKSRVRQLLITTPLSLIVVDYLQLMNDPAVKEGRQQEVASISRNLKQMAREANCPIIALSQMSRAVEQRSKEQKPQLSDLRESGAIEQDADIVAFIYREDKVKDPDEIPEDQKNKAEIIIAKNRAGQTKNFPLAFTPEYSRFDNLSST